MKTLTERLDEIKARAEKATPGPWRPCDNPTDEDKLVDGELAETDRQFIAHSRTDVVRLVEALGLAIYYVDGDSSLNILEHKICAILRGEK